jgi:hypothetical protein
MDGFVKGTIPNFLVDTREFPSKTSLKHNHGFSGATAGADSPLLYPEAVRKGAHRRRSKLRLYKMGTAGEEPTNRVHLLGIRSN